MLAFHREHSLLNANYVTSFNALPLRIIHTRLKLHLVNIKDR